MADSGGANPDIKDCCKVPENLEEARLSSELTVRVCQECGCRHFELEAETANLGAMGASL